MFVPEVSHEALTPPGVRRRSRSCGRRLLETLVVFIILAVVDPLVALNFAIVVLINTIVIVVIIIVVIIFIVTIV